MPTVTLAVPPTISSFESIVADLLEEFADVPKWSQAIRAFQTMARFSPNPMIVLLPPRGNGLLYHPNHVPFDDKPPAWIVWRASDNRFYTGTRAALIAGAGIAVEELP